jgi:hypothetical protein
MQSIGVIPMVIYLLCRLERPHTGSWLDISIGLKGDIQFIETNLEGILSMVYPGWELVSYCPA